MYNNRIFCDNCGDKVDIIRVKESDKLIHKCPSCGATYEIENNAILIDRKHISDNAIDFNENFIGSIIKTGGIIRGQKCPSCGKTNLYHQVYRNLTTQFVCVKCRSVFFNDIILD